MAALAYDPKNLIFAANGQSYMLVRQFRTPDRANLPHVGDPAARKVVEAAVRANPNLAQQFNKTFSHNVGNIRRFNGASNPVADAILQIQRKELYLLKLGPVKEVPKDVVAAAGGNVRTFKLSDAGDYARAGRPAVAAPIPRDPIDRLILVVQGLADLTLDDVGAKMWESVKGLTEGRVIGALTTAFTAFVMAQLSGPAALILDSALLGYGLYTLGTGVFQFVDDIGEWWGRVTTAQTRADLKKLSIALALILAVFAIERVIALLARGGKKKGGGGNEASGTQQTAGERVKENRAKGNAFRDDIAARMKAEGRDVSTEVYKSTPFGKRYIDIEVSKDGKILGGIETKVGGSRYTPAQRAKDMWLKLNDGYIVNVVRDK